MYSADLPGGGYATCGKVVLHYSDTLVSTVDGLRPIRDVTIGDMVWAYNEAARATGLYPVIDVITHVDPSIIRLTIGDEELRTTAEHPFFVLGRGWVEVENLLIGTVDGRFVRDVDCIAVVTLPAMTGLPQ